MTTVDHGEMQVFTYFIHWSPSELYFLLYFPRKKIYGGQPVYIYKDACRVRSKTTKIYDGRQQPFEQARLLTNDLVVNCDMSFLTNQGGVEPTSGPKITITSFCDLQTSYQGQNMVSI